MKMKLNRDHVLQHKSGLAVEFKKDQPVHVPPRMVTDAKMLGAECVDTDEAAIAEAERAVNGSAEEAAKRAPAIEACVRKMVARNQRGDFTAGGRPNRQVIFRETGLEVSAEELEPIWTKVAKDIE